MTDLAEVTGEGKTPRTDALVNAWPRDVSIHEAVRALNAMTTLAKNLERELAAEKERADAAIASWDEERGRAQREGERVIAERERADCMRGELANLRMLGTPADNIIQRNKMLQVQLAAVTQSKQEAVAQAYRDAADSFTGHEELWTPAIQERILALLPESSIAKVEGMVRDAEKWRKQNAD